MIASEIYFKRMGSLLPSLCTCGCSLYQSTSMGGNFHNNKIRREKVGGSKGPEELSPAGDCAAQRTGREKKSEGPLAPS